MPCTLLLLRTRRTAKSDIESAYKPRLWFPPKNVLDGPRAGFYIAGMKRTYSVIVGCGGLGSAALHWLSRELGSGHALKFADLALERESAYPIEPFGLTRPAITYRAFEKTFHA